MIRRWKERDIIFTIYILPPALFFHKGRDQIIDSLFRFIIDQFHAVPDTKVPNVHTQNIVNYTEIIKKHDNSILKIASTCYDRTGNSPQPILEADWALVDKTFP